MDVAQKFKESHDLRPRSIHHSTGGTVNGAGGDITEKSPSPSRQHHSPSPIGQLPSLPEEDEDDLFKTAVGFSMFAGTQTDSITDREEVPIVTVKDEVDFTAEERQPPISTQEAEKLTDPGEENYPISPDASVEMAITRFSVIRLQELNLIESTDPEDSVSSVSSTSVLERTAFLQDSVPLLRTGGPPSLPLVEASHRSDSINTRESQLAQAYNDLYSLRDSSAAGTEGFGAALQEQEEETDAAVEPLAQPQEPTVELASPEQVSPNQLRHKDHSDGQHVHFNVQTNENQKGNQLQLPLSFGEDGRSKRKKKKIGCLRQPSSDGPMRSLSIYNPQMEVLTSVIGHSVVHRTSENIGGQKILCLDGGGVKGLIQIEMLKTIEQMTGKSISELFDWVVGTSTGGILALGMIYGGLSLQQLRCMYFEMKDTVFKRQSKFISHTCDTNALEELLKRMLGTDKRMDDIKKPNILITAVDKRTTKLPLVFFNNCFDDDEKKSIRNEFVWKAARYTSAAPVFFAECDNYVDGGVVANNPTTFALPEIQEFLTKKHGYKSKAAKISCVVSLGCGIYPPEPLGNTDIADALNITKLYSAPRRLSDLLTLLTTALGGSEDMARICRINCEQQGISYFRFSPEIGEDVGTTEKDNRKLCEIIIRAKALFVDNSEQVEEMIRMLGCSVQDERLYHV